MWLAKNKKFEKLGVNEKYVQQHSEEATENEKNDRKKSRGGLFGKIKSKLDERFAGISPEKKPSTNDRFTYTKSKRADTVKVKEEKNPIPKAPVMPMVLFLSCMCLSLAGAFFLDTDFVYSKSFFIQITFKIIVSICVYTIPVIVYVFSSKKRCAYNVRRCSLKFMPLMLVFLGLVLSSSALQKYLIAYVFSYREPLGVQQESLILTCLAGALVPAICEELLMRGVLQYEFSRYAGGAGGVLFTALLFTMLHFDVRFFFVYFAAGIILGTLTHVTKSVFPAMAVHFVNNTLAICLSDRLTFVALERIGGKLLIIVLASLCFIFLAVALQMMEKISMKRAVYYLGSKKRSTKSIQQDESDDEITGKEAPILFTAEQGDSAKRTSKLFANALSAVCYVFFLVTVLVVLR